MILVAVITAALVGLAFLFLGKVILMPWESASAPSPSLEA